MPNKSLRLQVLIEPEIYNKLIETLKEIKAPIKTESEGVRYAIQMFLDYELNVKLTIYAMKQQLDRNKKTIEEQTHRLEALQATNNNYFNEKQQLEITIEQLRKKLEALKDESKSKPGKKKPHKKVL